MNIREQEINLMHTLFPTTSQTFLNQKDKEIYEGLLLQQTTVHRLLQEDVQTNQRPNLPTTH